MKNKGFTLIELIASIAILAMLSTIIVVAVSKSINKAKEDANATMLKAIKLAAEDYAINNEGILTDFSANDWVDIKLETLIKNNYFDNELKDFVTKENIPITNVVRVSRSYNGKITTTYDENQNEVTKISLNGSYNTYVKKGDTYEEEGVTATTPSGANVSSSVVVSGTVDTNTLGTYVLTYTYQTVSITRNVIVSETDNLVSTWHTITVNPNGGTYSGSTSNTIYSIKQGRTQTIAVPTRLYYTFLSWSKTCTSCYNTSTRVYTVGTSNDTLTAVWQQDPTVTLTVNLNGGSTSQTFSATYPMNTSLTLTTPSKSGSIFVNWSATTTGGSSVSGNTLTIGTANVTLTANFYTYASMYTYTGSSTVIDDGSGNWRIKFLTSGTFTPLVNFNIDAFIVGGGGGGAVGGSASGRGGGGGGYTSTVSSISIVANTAYAITIGNGGGQSTNGGASSGFGYSAGGGAGAVSSGAAGGAGGSGGGAGGYNSTYRSGAAGGSNGAAGSSTNYAGGGGQGSTTYEFGNSSLTLYAGGGGGGAYYSRGGGGTGGAGGGANGGATYNNGASAAANTGGGGGGGAGDRHTGGSGGSGIVVIRNHR